MKRIVNSLAGCEYPTLTEQIVKDHIHVVKAKLALVDEGRELKFTEMTMEDPIGGYEVSMGREFVNDLSEEEYEAGLKEIENLLRDSNINLLIEYARLHYDNNEEKLLEYVRTLKSNEIEKSFNDQVLEEMKRQYLQSLSTQTSSQTSGRRSRRSVSEDDENVLTKKGRLVSDLQTCSTLDEILNIKW